MASTRTDDPFTARRVLILAVSLLVFAIVTVIGYGQRPTRDPFSPEPAWASLEWWKSPVERNAFRRPVDWQGAEMNNGGDMLSPDGWSRSYLGSGYIFPDGQRGWVGIAGKSFLVTNDGGHSWSAQRFDSIQWKTFLSPNFNEQPRWAVGKRGELYKSSDGGLSWPEVGKAHFLPDLSQGWRVGFEGRIGTTVDGAKSWREQTSPIKGRLRAVYVLNNGRRGWIVGDDGIILATDNGGAKWVKQKSGVKAALTSTYALDKGLRAWAVGDQGTFLSTTDGGKTWQQPLVKPRDNFLSIHFSDDGKVGLLVGHDVMLVSHDGGSNWQMPRYQRFPAPWLYAAWVTILLLTLLALLLERKIRFESAVESLLVSDESLSRPEDDRLGHRQLVAALSAFLRNRRTAPPLSVAITARWGKGKSSVMRLLSRSLERHGASTVWFNAWHHQKEEVMLAALLENIRAQAVPLWLSPWGLWFRLALLLQRIQRHYLVATFVGAWFWFGIALFFDHWDKVGPALRAIPFKPLFQAKWENFTTQLLTTLREHPELFHLFVEMVALAGSLTFILLYGLRAFPEHPAVLLATFSEKFKTRHAEAQTVFRYKFARHFGDVCRALRPRTLTVFIDDLDRCTPEKALETLEATNYLASSGACFIILGMDKKVVEKLVGVASEKLAKEMTEEATALNGGDTGMNEVEGRRTYARQYLEKLVNFELPVPAVGASGYTRLAGQGRHWHWVGSYDAMRESARVFLPYLLALVLGVTATAVFMQWHPLPLAGEELRTLAPATQPGKNEKPQLARAPIKQTIDRRQAGGGGFVPADPLNDYPWPLWMVVLLMVYALFFLPMTRGRYVVDDSDEFRKALEIWLPLAMASRNSPRQAKRFINHVRFLAMRSRGAAPENGIREKLIFLEAFLPGAWQRARGRRAHYRTLGMMERLRRLKQLGRRALGIWQRNGDSLPPEKLVALAAIHYVFPEMVDPHELEELALKLNLNISGANRDSVDATFLVARARHKSAFSSQWLPTDNEMEIFRRWVKDSLREA